MYVEYGAHRQLPRCVAQYLRPPVTFEFWGTSWHSQKWVD